MWPELVIVALIGGVVALDTTAAWQIMICRPIVSGPLVGCLLGDLPTGLLIGAMAELVWAGCVPAGASAFPDSNVAVVVAVSLAIQLQKIFPLTPFTILLSILYMVPVAYCGSTTIIWMRKRNGLLLERALRSAETGDGRGITRQNWLGAVNALGRGVLFSGFSFAVGFLLLRAILAFIPSVSGDVVDLSRVPIAALGGAVMLTIFGSRRMLPYLVFGAVLGYVISLI